MPATLIVHKREEVEGVGKDRSHRLRPPNVVIVLGGEIVGKVLGRSRKLEQAKQYRLVFLSQCRPISHEYRGGNCFHVLCVILSCRSTLARYSNGCSNGRGMTSVEGTLNGLAFRATLEPSQDRQAIAILAESQRIDSAVHSGALCVCP
jgi:hypothetical protein